MKYRYFFLTVFLAATYVLSGARTIEGYVRDSRKGDVISGARIGIKETGEFTYTNKFGYFSLSFRGLENTLVAYATGYERHTEKIDSSTHDYLEIWLDPTDYLIPENISNEGRIPEALTEPVSGFIELSMDIQRDMPVLGSELDPIKSLQMLPGVEFGREGMGELFVRGGGARQNLYNLNGIPVYGDNHAFGFLSVFNRNEISNIGLYRGAYPARFGGRLSSVVDVTSSYGNKDETAGYGYGSPLTIGFGINGPIGGSGNTSFALSGRRSYLDILLFPYFDGTGLVANFYDLQLNWETKISDKTTLQFHSLFARDNYVLPIQFSDSASTENWDFGWHYTTAVVGARLNHIYSKRLFGSFSLGYSYYSPRNELDIRTSDTSLLDPSEYDIRFYTGNFDVLGSADMEWKANDDHFVRYGATVNMHGFNTGRYEEESRNVVGEVLNDVTLGDKGPSIGIESAVYVEDVYAVSPNFTINAGARFVLYTYDGLLSPHVEPRILMAYRWNESSTIKLSYMRVNQFLHSLNNDGVSIFMNRWIPSSSENQPGQSNQINAALVKHISESLEFHIEGYYKTFSNLYLEKDASSVARWVDYSSSLYKGAGTAYGAEFFLQKLMGSVTGYASYAIAEAERQFDELNGEDPFPFNFDRRHTFKIGFRYNMDGEYTLTANLVVGSGLPYTLPNSIYRNINGEIILGYEQINNYRADWYRRLDLGLTKINYSSGSGQKLTLSLYNVFGTKNTSNVFFQRNEDSNVLLYDAYKNVAFVFIPGIHYELIF